jgi:hypothetical protein
MLCLALIRPHLTTTNETPSPFNLSTMPLNQSKLGSQILPFHPFNIAIVLHLLGHLIIHGGNGLHDAPAVALQVLQTLLEALSHAVHRLHRLHRVRRLTVPEDVQFLELRDRAAHVLRGGRGTLIYPMELAMPAP